MATINSLEDQDGITIGWQAIVRRKGHPSQTKTFRAVTDRQYGATEGRRNGAISKCLKWGLERC